MEKEKFYYIKCYIRIDEEYRPYVYFMEFDWYCEKRIKPLPDISTISVLEFAKKYKRKIWAEKMIEKIYERTKENFFLFDDEGNYKYKFEIVEI